MFFNEKINYKILYTGHQLILKKIKRQQKIPFGAFLSLSGLIVWQFGNQVFMRLIFSIFNW